VRVEDQGILVAVSFGGLCRLEQCLGNNPIHSVERATDCRNRGCVARNHRSVSLHAAGQSHGAYQTKNIPSHQTPYVILAGCASSPVEFRSAETIVAALAWLMASNSVPPISEVVVLEFKIAMQNPDLADSASPKGCYMVSGIAKTGGFGKRLTRTTPLAG
jgi:hypothetical protein